MWREIIGLCEVREVVLKLFEVEFILYDLELVERLYQLEGFFY
jgi:hypothetical protein